MTTTIEAESVPTVAKPEDLSYELAIRAHSGTSFVPETRAKAEQQEYANDVNGLYRELVARAVNDDQKRILSEEIERYRQNYLRMCGAYLSSRAGIMSTMITGPANFPVRRMEKRNQWAHNKLTAFLDWRKKARAAICRRLSDARSTEQVESEEWRVLRSRLLRSLGTIRSIDTGPDKFYDRSAFVSGITGRVERLANNGSVALVDKALELVREYNSTNEKPAISDRHKFWTFGDIARRQAGALQSASTAEPVESAVTDGVRLVSNQQIDRAQIFFDSKPPENMRTSLKREGWRWSPREGAWQRQLTANAIASAKRILSIA